MNSNREEKLEHLSDLCDELKPVKDEIILKEEYEVNEVITEEIDLKYEPSDSEFLSASNPSEFTNRHSTKCKLGCNSFIKDIHQPMKNEQCNQLYECFNCDYKTTQKDCIAMHVKIHNRLYKRSICLFSGSTKCTLINHMVIRESKSRFECSDCDYRTFDKLNLSRHVKRKHSTEKPFKCLSCDYKTSIKGDINRHAIIHKGKLFKCSDCDYSSRTKTNLNRHMKIHNRPYKCSICLFSTTTRFALDNHMLTHECESHFKCSHCDYQTFNKQSLSKHIKRKHSAEKPFVCQSCDYKTSIKGDMNRHAIIHKGKPFKCADCGYRSRTKIDLNRHINTCGSEHFFKCLNCDYRTIRKYCIAMHVKIHNRPFKCSVCLFSTTSKFGLNKHMMTHGFQV